MPRICRETAKIEHNWTAKNDYPKARCVKMKKYGRKTRDIVFFSAKNQTTLCVHTPQARRYAKLLEEDTRICYTGMAAAEAQQYRKHAQETIHMHSFRSFLGWSRMRYLRGRRSRLRFVTGCRNWQTLDGCSPSKVLLQNWESVQNK